jgi:PleD family two-component response regulator
MTASASAAGDTAAPAYVAADSAARVVGPMSCVLVADDSAENRALAKATLEDEDIPVVLAATGEEALTAFGGKIWIEDAAPGTAFCIRRDDAA